MIKRTIIIFLAVVCAGLIGLVGYKIVTLTLQNAKAFDDDLPSTYQLSKEDSSVISPAFHASLRVNEVKQSTVRAPISVITIADEYSLIIHKINLNHSYDLRSIVSVRKESVDRSDNTTYSIIDNGAFRFQTKAGRIKPASTILITLSGEDIHSDANMDSIVSYNLLCRSVAIRYGVEEPFDIFVESNSGKKIPMEVLVLRRSNSAYFLLLSSNNLEKLVPKGLLRKIVTGKE